MRGLLWFLLFLALPVKAEQQSYQLVCFERDGLTAVLDKIVNEQQFLRNSFGQTISSKEINRRGCSLVRIPSGSVARQDGFYKSEKGFLFPLFKIRYRTTGQYMYAADGIFSTKYWTLTVSKWCRGMLGHCIAPRTCEVLDGYLQLTGKEIPDYLYQPRECLPYEVTVM